MNPLLHYAVANLLIYNDADGAGIDVEDAAGSSMVELIGHAFMNGAIDGNIDIVADFIVGEGFGDVDGAFLSEGFGKFISGFPSVAVAVGHVW